MLCSQHWKWNRRTHIRPPKSRDKGIPNKLFIADQPVSIVHLFPRSDFGSKILVQYRVCTKHIEKVARGALEHHWYPVAVRLKSGALPVSLTGSVTMADRRGADHGNGFTMSSSKEKGDRDAGPFKATDSRSLCYGAGKAV